MSRYRLQSVGWAVHLCERWQATRGPVPCLGLFLGLALLCTCSSRAAPGETGSLLIVVGASGQPEFGSNFVRQAELWETAANRAGWRKQVVGLQPAAQTNDYDLLKLALDLEPKTGTTPLWLVLIGHGTFDGKEARFNLRGPDLSATDLALWLKPLRRPLAFIDTSSASAPFLNQLAASNRVVITATRSGYEQNFTRFGLFLSEALTDSRADLDKDGQVSLLEAFLQASRRAAEFYKIEKRLATEHALLDDNGDGLGTQADWFRGLRAIKSPKEKAAVDGLLARQFVLVPAPGDISLSPEQLARRNAIEQAVFKLRDQKQQLSEQQYYGQLEKLLLELARILSGKPS